MGERKKREKKKEKEKVMTAGQASKGVTKMPLRFERCVCLEGSVWSSFFYSELGLAFGGCSD